MKFETLFEGQDLSEEFKAQVSTMFEAAVSEAVAAKETALVEQFDIQKATLVAEHKDELAQLSEKADAYGKYVAESFEEKITEASKQYDQKIEDYMTNEVYAKVDSFLNYVAEQWMEENKLAVESGVKSEMVESFLSGLHGLFQEHYIEVPEAKVDLVDQLTAQMEEVKAQLNTTIGENVELKSFIREKAKDALVAEVGAGLVETQIERLGKIAEGMEFKDEASFKAKLATVRETLMAESVVPGGKKEPQKPAGAVAALTEQFDTQPEMGSLVAELTRLGTKK